MRDPGNLARDVYEDVSSILLARPCKDELVTDGLCTYSIRIMTCDNEHFASKTLRREAYS
jgi:hypothetical protein